jgi:5-methylcytosine-specific restriction endonuclease McrA
MSKIRKESYPVDVVIDLINSKNRRVKLDGDEVRVKGIRMKSFAVNGIKCVTCGLVGTFFVKEKLPGDNSFHLNLYAVDKDGKEVLMTRDHIQPKSKGGPETLENMQTMCTRCNGKKGNKV